MCSRLLSDGCTIFHSIDGSVGLPQGNWLDPHTFSSSISITIRKRHPLWPTLKFIHYVTIVEECKHQSMRVRRSYEIRNVSIAKTREILINPANHNSYLSQLSLMIGYIEQVSPFKLPAVTLSNGFVGASTRKQLVLQIESYNRSLKAWLFNRDNRRSIVIVYKTISSDQWSTTLGPQVFLFNSL
jgi:hypothetical protein